MTSNPLKLLRKSLIFFVVLVLLSSRFEIKPEIQSAQASVTDTACRFGITSPLGSEGFDIASIGVGSYLDWGAASNPVLPAGVEYIRVLRLRDDLYPHTLQNLPL